MIEILKLEFRIYLETVIWHLEFPVLRTGISGFGISLSPVKFSAQLSYDSELLHTL